MNLLKRIFWLPLAALTLMSCVKDEVEVNDLSYGISPEFGVPVALANISAHQVIDNIEGNEVIEVGQDGAVSLVFIDSLRSFNANDLLNLEDQLFEFEQDLTALEYATLFGEGSYTVVEDEIFSFVTEEGDRIDSVRFSSGTFTLNINTQSTIPISGFIRVFDNDDEEIYSTSFQDANPPISISQQEEFTNMRIDLINDQDITNGLRIQYEITYTIDEGSAVTGPLDIGLGLVNYEVGSAGGFIAPRSASLDDIDVGIDIFDDSFTANFSFANPQLNLHFDNSLGIDLGFQIDELYGINADMELFSVLENGFDPFPLIEGANSIGENVNTVISISNENMNPSLTDFMAFKPEYVSGFFTANVNPTQEPSSFIAKNSELGITLEAILPIYGSISDFILEDTAEVSLGELISDANETSEVEQADIRLIVDNGLPVDAGVQIVFTDSLFNPIDELFEDEVNIFSSAPVNTSVATDDPNYGRATGKTRTMVEVSIPKERLTDLEDASQMLIRVYGSTSDGGNQDIRLFSEDEIEIRLAAKLKLNFDE